MGVRVQIYQNVYIKLIHVTFYIAVTTTNL